jgi:predicted component of type VI protein secretion system
MAAQFQFVMRSGPTVGKVTTLTTPEVSIGRDTSNTLVINDAEVSRKHARMELRGSSYLIQDLGSTNGTFINGKRVSGLQVLNAGDLVSFGEGIVLFYEAQADLNATVLSSKAPSTAVSRPVPAPAAASNPTPRPAPTPRPIPTPPAPVYSGRVPAGPASSSPVPAGPVPMPEETPKSDRKFPVWVIVLILLVVVICGCIGFFLIIDQFSLWCKVVPFLVPILGGTC